MENTKICCFTGHRHFDRQDILLLQTYLDTLLENLINQGFRVFRVGGAIGFDMLVEELLLEKKENGRDIRLELVLPCHGQEAKWSPEDKRRYVKILRDADSVEYVCEEYTPGCMHARNRRMVDGSQLCVAYCTHTSGGSYNTCRYAEEKGIPLINLANGLESVRQGLSSEH